MRRKQHTIFREEGAYRIRVSLEPSLFVLAMYSLYFCEVVRGQAAGRPQHRTKQ